jgi:hypothetical protein
MHLNALFITSLTLPPSNEILHTSYFLQGDELGMRTENRSHRITISLSERDYLAVQDYATAEGASLSWVIRKALTFFLQDPRRPRLPIAESQTRK